MRKQYVEACVCCDVRHISGEAEPIYQETPHQAALTHVSSVLVVFLKKRQITHLPQHQLHGRSAPLQSNQD